MFFKYLLLIPKVVQLNYGLKSGMIFKGTTRGYKHIFVLLTPNQERINLYPLMLQTE